MNSPKPGLQFGNWTLKEFLGKGGNGEVWKAVDGQGQEAAIKILKPVYRNPNNSRFKRFRDEILALKMLDKMDGILPLIDFELPDTPSNASPPWFVMPLAEEVRNSLGEKSSLQEIVTAIASIAGTLAALHKQGICHRDIKPANLYRYKNAWVLGDFGLVEYPEKEEVTVAGEVVGPRFYMASEMMFGAIAADGRPADVLSLAKTLWVLATGFNFPPPGQQRYEFTPYTIQTIRNESNAFLLDRLIERSTDVNPTKRPTMEAFAAELHAWLAPAAAGSLPPDFSDLAASVVDLVDTARKQSDETRRLIAIAEAEMLPLLSKWAEEHLKNLSKTSSFLVTQANPSTIYQVFMYSLPAFGNPIWTNGIELQMKLDSKHQNCLISGISLSMYPDGTVYVWAAHILLKARGLGPGEVQWRLMKSFQVGSAAGNKALTEIIEEMNLNVRPALTQLIEQIRNPPPNPLLNVISTAITPLAEEQPGGDGKMKATPSAINPTEDPDGKVAGS